MNPHDEHMYFTRGRVARRWVERMRRLNVSGSPTSFVGVESDRPAPGEELNRGPETVPRLAATVILLRGGAERLEVLLVKRNPESRFMGGAWVFPGGAVDKREGRDDGALRAAALREVREEAGVELADAAGLIPFSRWITPAEVKIRFDTWFYLAPLPAGCHRHGRRRRGRGRALVRAGCSARGGPAWQLFLVFPTIKHLEQLSPFASADELIAHARGREIRPVQPQVLVSGESARIVLPGEPGYED